MLFRLIGGALIGAVLGGIVAAALVKGLGIVAFGAVLAYVTAAITGVLAGLFAGKPVWAAGGQIEAGLKAFFGALLAAGGMFAIRQWVHVPVDLSAWGAGAGELGSVPAAALPLIAGVLGALFGADNTPNPEEKNQTGGASRPPARAAKGNGKTPISAEEAEDESGEEDVGASRRARR